MTTESTQPQSDLEQVPANVQGQSQGHRRRRRRRKSKSSQQGAPQPQQQAQAPQPPPQPQPQVQPAQQMQQPVQQMQPVQHKRPAHQNHSQGQGQGQARKKKKFFQKGSPTPAQPGNSIAAPQQNKRKTRQKGPREFVGPMDHSYRVANGNVADGPPSTINLGNGHGAGYYQEAYSAAPPVPVREDSPTRIFCFIEDLFFQAKINETARKLGIKVEFVKNGDKDALARITELPEDQRPRLLVFDLNNLNAKPITLIPKFKAKLKKATSIIGFLNHLQGELKAKAVEVGCDTVMPRSAFSQSMPGMLRRYGLDEEEDNTPQPIM
jgi:CheY-like chemotaxis protein